MKVKSQIRTTKIVSNFSSDIKGGGIELVNNILKKIHKKIRKIELEPEKEGRIRWKRTATQILEDGWVVRGKACTDLTVVFIAIAKAKGLKTRFVKLYSIKRKMLHSAVELKIDGKRVYLDVTNGKFDDADKEIVFDEYKVYKKGRNSWDVGLDSFSKGVKVSKELY